MPAAVIARGGAALVPIRRNGRAWNEDCPAAKGRSETLRAPRHDGLASRTRWPGYRARRRVEARMRCLKPRGERNAPRDPDRQTAEPHIRVAPIDPSNALDTAKVVRVV